MSKHTKFIKLVENQTTRFVNLDNIAEIFFYDTRVTFQLIDNDSYVVFDLNKKVFSDVQDSLTKFILLNDSGILTI